MNRQRKKIMKIFIKYIFVLVAALLVACQPCSYRTVYPEETPEMTASLAQTSVIYGADSLTLNVSISASQTPLSTLTVKILVGQTLISSEVLRTKDYQYDATLNYAIPFVAGLEEGATVAAYLTAENVEGVQAQQILNTCTGHRPSIETLYIMPPTINYTAIGKGTQMTLENGKFVAYELGFPKSFECLLATVGTRFGRVDWSQPVFGMINGKISVITQEQFENGEATSIVLADDNYSSIDTVIFDPISFDLTFSGTITTPVTAIDINVDLEETATYIGSTSVQKEYRGAKVYMAKDSEIEITGCVDLSKAYNLDYMEYLGGNKVKFLGETAIYYVSYKTAEDYLVVEPLYDLVYPEVMYLCGVGMGQPSWTPKATSGWGFDSPNQNFVARTIAPKIYQFTVYMLNDAENTDHPGFGAVNFKFFHQHGWGGEETSLDYGQTGLNIVSSTEESNVGNWWSTADPLFEGVYRITLDMNAMTTSYEKIR